MSEGSELRHDPRDEGLTHLKRIKERNVPPCPLEHLSYCISPIEDKIPKDTPQLPDASFHDTQANILMAARDVTREIERDY